MNLRLQHAKNSYWLLPIMKSLILYSERDFSVPLSAPLKKFVYIHKPGPVMSVERAE